MVGNLRDYVRDALATEFSLNKEPHKSGQPPGGIAAGVPFNVTRADQFAVSDQPLSGHTPST